MIRKYVYIAIAATLLSLSGAAYVLYADNKKLSAELSLAIEAREAAKAELNNLRTALSRVQEDYRENRNALRRTEQYLEAMKGREATVVAKPKLVEKLIQKAVSEREKQFECATGGLCEESSQ